MYNVTKDMYIYLLAIKTTVVVVVIGLGSAEEDDAFCYWVDKKVYVFKL